MTKSALALAVLLLAPALPARAAVDAFGVSQLYPTISGGQEWLARFDGPARSATWGPDSVDPWLHWKGDATYRIDGAGQLSVTGATPRVYIYDPAGVRQWRNVEITVYAKRAADDGTPYAGIVSVARSNHMADTTALCDTRGLGSRVRYDGTTDFDKETSHPNAVAVASKPLFPGGLPFGAWIGVKHLVYDLPDGRVVNETWVDRTDGASGGAWVKVNSFVDDGTNMGVGGVACAPGISPTLPLTAAASRQGSESGLPNLVVYFRSTNVGPDGLVYKKMSVREIDPAAPAPAPMDLARHKLLSASSATGLPSAAEFANDGDFASAWTAAASDPQWLAADLGAQDQVAGALIHWGASFAPSYELQTSTDGARWASAYATTAGAGGDETVAFATATARFVRMLAFSRSGAGGVSVRELELRGAPAPGADLIPPLISGIQTIVAGAADGLLRVAWTTDEPSDTRLDYGATPYYGLSAVVDPAPRTQHAVTLGPLPIGAVYHYRVSSVDAGGNVARSADRTAVIGAAGAPALTDDDARSVRRFLTPALADGINDAAVFGPAAVEVTIMDPRGRRVFHSAGGAPIVWDGRDGGGRLVESGVYIARIRRSDAKVLYQSLAVAK